jgi:hypothetical protein
VDEPLIIYLQDHLAGATVAIKLLQAMREREGPLGSLAKYLLTEVEADRKTLQALSNRIGPGQNVLKEMAGWLTERASRLKFGHNKTEPFETFQGLEFLSLGILGKVALWRALEVLSLSDSRLTYLPFHDLVLRARTQFSEVEERRLEIASTAFLRTR